MLTSPNTGVRAIWAKTGISWGVPQVREEGRADAPTEASDAGRGGSSELERIGAALVDSEGCAHVNVEDTRHHPHSASC